MAARLGDQRLDIELRRPHWRDAECHHESSHAVDAPGRAFLGKLPIARGIAVNDGIARAHLQYRVIAMAQLLFQNDAFEVAQGGAHAFETLAKAYELVL